MLGDLAKIKAWSRPAPATSRTEALLKAGKLTTTRRIAPKRRAAPGVRTRLRSSNGDIQAMVQAAFYHPVTSLDREHALGLEFFQRETSHQIYHFTAPLAVAVDPRF
jgi:hypothetical protein